MALNTVSSDRLSTNVKTSNLGTELSKKVGQSKNLIINGSCQIAQRGAVGDGRSGLGCSKVRNYHAFCALWCAVGDA